MQGNLEVEFFDLSAAGGPVGGGISRATALYLAPEIDSEKTTIASKMLPVVGGGSRVAFRGQSASFSFPTGPETYLVVRVNARNNAAADDAVGIARCEVSSLAGGSSRDVELSVRQVGSESVEIGRLRGRLSMSGVSARAGDGYVDPSTFGLLSGEDSEAPGGLEAEEDEREDEPVGMGLYGGIPAPIATPALSELGLIAGRAVFLRGEETKHYLSWHESSDLLSDADARVGTFSSASWTPIPDRFIKLQNVAYPHRFLAIRGGEVTVGAGGPFCELQLIRGLDSHGAIALHSVAEALAAETWNVGVYPDGRVRPPAKTGTGRFGRWIPSVLARDGERDIASVRDPFLDMPQGAVACLQSVATSKYLRLTAPDGNRVDAHGGMGPESQWYVHCTRTARFRASLASRPAFIRATTHSQDAGGNGDDDCVLDIRNVGSKGATVKLQAVQASRNSLAEALISVPGTTDTNFEVCYVE